MEEEEGHSRMRRKKDAATSAGVAADADAEAEMRVLRQDQSWREARSQMVSGSGELRLVAAVDVAEQIDRKRRRRRRSRGINGDETTPRVLVFPATIYIVRLDFSHDLSNDTFARF